MEYYFSKLLNTSFDEAIKLTNEALKTKGLALLLK
jgi:hypothetical protein